MVVQIRPTGFAAIVGDANLETLASGYGFLEGPVWHPYEKWLVFSDIPNNRMYRRRPDGVVETFRDPSNMANGNTLDRQGRLLSCEHATSRVTRARPDGSSEVLVTHYGEKALNSPNDIVVAIDGAIYFTDPNYGRRDYFGVRRAQELAFQGIYRLDTAGLTLLADDFARWLAAFRQRYRARAHPGVRRRGQRRSWGRRRLGGDERRWARRARRHEDR
jgi:gluconolactonase